LNSRKSIYNYLFVREVTKRKRAVEKAAVQERRIQSSHRHAELAAAGLPKTNYPGYTSMFRQLAGGHTERWLRDNKLVTQARLGEHILIDCGFEVEHARSKYISKLVDQLEYFFANIHRYHSPSFATLCNLATDGQIQQEFSRRFSQHRGITCFETTESSYLDLFDRQKLIYLSPHSSYEMSEYDHDAVYIVGAIVDISKSDLMKFCFVNSIYIGVGGRPLTLAKAKRDNIKHQRLPLERYLK
jgi:ribonuclease P protein 1